MNFASQESDCEFNYGASLIQKTFVKSFETGLRDGILASNLRPTLRTPELTDEELIRQVNELASQQAEKSSKLASKRQKSAKVHACGVGKEEREARAKNATTDGGQQLLLEIRPIKSEINDLKDQVNRRGSQAENSNWRGPSCRGRGRGYQPNRTSWSCQNCKQRGRGDECNHCFACGDSGHVARECYRNENRGSRQGNGRRLFRRDAE